MQDDRPSVTVDDYRKHLTTNVNNIASVVRHRIEYGSPMMMTMGMGTMGVGAYLPIQLRQDRIRRRRQLLGLKYETWQPPKGI